MMTKVLALTALATTIALAGCGGGAPAPAADATDASPSAAAPAKGPPKDWNAADACTVVDKRAMAVIVGQAVDEARLGNVNQSDGVTAATSECTYTLADGQTASVMLRWSPIGDNSEGSINLTRNGLEQTLKGFGGKVETIEGLGKAAFWADMTRSLNVFIGEDKFVIINAPPGAKAREQAVTLAHKLGA